MVNDDLIIFNDDLLIFNDDFDFYDVLVVFDEICNIYNGQC